MAAAALLIPAALLAVASAAPPCQTCKGPKFSWDTMPVFIHGSNQSGPINQDAIALMAKYPLVTVEKFVSSRHR